MDDFNFGNLVVGLGCYIDFMMGKECLDIGCVICYIGELYYKGMVLRVDGG